MRRQVALTRGERLFIKNTGHRKAEMPSTMADACSLLVPESPVQREEGPVKSGGNSDLQPKEVVKSGYMLGTQMVRTT